MNSKCKGIGKGKVALVSGITSCVGSAGLPTLIFDLCTDLK